MKRERESAGPKLLRGVVSVIALGGKENSAECEQVLALSILYYYKVCAGIRSKIATGRIKKFNKHHFPRGSRDAFPPIYTQQKKSLLTS